MPRELIFTSVPSGLKPGSSGYCTVARHEDMDPMLERELERLSFYEMDGGLHPVIHAFRILRLQSGNHYVLSRICYSGSDHTGRTNYIAHHLVFDETETHGLGGASPADYFLDTIGWMDEWPKGKQPVLFGSGKGEKAPYPASPTPASNSTWARITGDPLNAHEPLYRHSWRFITPDGGHAEPLSLISEFCSQPQVNVQWAWGTYTFTTFLQTSDQPGDFRCVAGPASGAMASVAHDTLHLGNPAATCFQAAGATTPGALTPQHVPVVEEAPAAQSQDANRQALEQSFVDEGEPITESAPTSEEPAYETVENDLMSRYTQPKQDDVPDPSQADVRNARRRKTRSGTRPDLLAGKRSNLNVGLEEKSKSSKKFLIFSLTFVFLSILGAGGYLFRGPIMKAFESTDEPEITNKEEGKEGDNGNKPTDSGSSEEDGEKKADPADPIKKQRELATKAVADAQTAFNDAEAAKEEADNAIKNFRPELKEEEPYKQWLSNSTDAGTAAETALTEAKAAKDNADNAKDLKTATDAAEEARSKATEAKNQKELAETAKTSVLNAIVKAKEKKATAEEAQANADVTLVPFKGDEKVPVKIVFVERLDIDTATDVFAWSTDQNKYDWMKSGKESEPLATRKDGGIKTTLATYKIKKRGKPVTIKAGSFSELRFEGKILSDEYLSYMVVAKQFVDEYAKIPDADKNARIIRILNNQTGKEELTFVNEINENLTKLLDDEEQNLKQFPPKLEDLPVISRISESYSIIKSVKSEVENNIKNTLDNKKNIKIQVEHRKEVCKILNIKKEKKEDMDRLNRWTQSAEPDGVIKTFLISKCEDYNIDPRGFTLKSCTLSQKKIKEIYTELGKKRAALGVRRTKNDKASVKTQKDRKKKTEETKEIKADIARLSSYTEIAEDKVKDKFSYFIQDIKKKIDAYPLAFEKNYSYDPVEVAKWEDWVNILKTVEGNLDKLKNVDFPTDRHTWQLKDGNTVMLEIIP